jgi:DNA-binding MarR family transcriptional regulator
VPTWLLQRLENQPRAVTHSRIAIGASTFRSDQHSTDGEHVFDNSTKVKRQLRPVVWRRLLRGVRRESGYNLLMVTARTSNSRRPKDDADVDTITDAVLTASRLLVAVSVRSVAAVDESITIPQFRLLVVLSTSGPMNLSVLADQLGVNPSTTTRMIDRLIASDLVDRQPNPQSRREVVVELTRTGVSVVAQVMQRRRREIARIVGRMAAQHRRGLFAALEAFSRAGGEPPVSISRPDTDWI